MRMYNKDDHRPKWNLKLMTTLPIAFKLSIVRFLFMSNMVRKGLENNDLKYDLQASSQAYMEN